MPPDLPYPEARDGGVWLPGPLANTLGQRLAEADEMGWICQVELDGLALAWKGYAEDLAAIERSEGEADVAEVRAEMAPFPWWGWLLVGGGVGAVVGAALLGAAIAPDLVTQ